MRVWESARVCAPVSMPVCSLCLRVVALPARVVVLRLQDGNLPTKVQRFLDWYLNTPGVRAGFLDREVQAASSSAVVATTFWNNSDEATRCVWVCAPFVRGGGGGGGAPPLGGWVQDCICVFHTTQRGVGYPPCFALAGEGRWWRARWLPRARAKALAQLAE
jgi:hypothetical protein